MMKKVKFLQIIVLLWFVAVNAYAQVGINTENPDPSAALDIVSKTGGMLVPRMTTAERTAISNPADGLLVYDTTESRLYIYNGGTASSWNKISESSDLAGNNGATTQVQYDIFLLAGQSNTHYGTGLDKNIDTTDPDIFQLGRFNGLDKVIIPASEPLQNWTWDQNKIGFALTFAKQYKQNMLASGRKVLIIPCGYAGTTIEQWAKGTDLYNDAVARTLLVLANNPGSVLKGILWHQGEYNASTSDATNATYQQNLDKFIQNIRNDLGNLQLPIVLGGMVPAWVDYYSYQKTEAVIKNTPNRVAKAAYADPRVPTEIRKANIYDDAIHYNAAGQRELGLRYWTAWQQMAK